MEFNTLIGSLSNIKDPYIIIIGLTLIVIFVLLVIVYKIIFFALDKLKSQEELTQLTLKKYYNINKDLNANNSQISEEKDYNIIEVYLKLQNILKRNIKPISLKLDADRIAIYLFHNGTYALNRFPFCKFTCICEYIKPNTRYISLKEIQKDIPVNALDDILLRLYTENIIVYNKGQTKSLVSNIINRFLVNDEYINSFILCSIKDASLLNEIPIGFIIVEFHDNITLTDEIKNEIEKIKVQSEYAVQISNYIKSKGGEL